MSELAQWEQPNQVAQQQDQPVSPVPQQALSQTVVDLQSWAQELDAAHRLGNALCQTDFVPKDFKGKPEAAAAAILAGKALGLDPMNSLSNIFVIHGKPALYARTMAGMVMEHGHELQRTVATPEQVTIMARRKGQAEWQEFTWTMQRAQTAGYTGNKLYKTDPIAMLTAKAQAEACRTIAPDVLTGVATYSVEDHQLDNIGAPTRPSRVAQPVEQVAEEPEFESITGDQWNELLAAGNAVGLDPAQVGALAADVIGTELRGPQDIPANQYDNIMANIQQPQHEGEQA
ncbi:MAG: hypothetical protein L0L76_10405 [Yaniella sp.]|uniref:hypothetical protein n=1 Tax=Yaniella sp. TaxID=2773929 RepID=UPI0026474263|nr:hypothetical protein [Yaniella sp.]MDN6759000.1 hypothetical protein [Yaniella sp.]